MSGVICVNMIQCCATCVHGWGLEFDTNESVVCTKPSFYLVYLPRIYLPFSSNIYLNCQLILAPLEQLLFSDYAKVNAHFSWPTFKFGYEMSA